MGVACGSTNPPVQFWGDGLDKAIAFDEFDDPAKRLWRGYQSLISRQSPSHAARLAVASCDVTPLGSFRPRARRSAAHGRPQREYQEHLVVPIPKSDAGRSLADRDRPGWRCAWLRGAASRRSP